MYVLSYVDYGDYYPIICSEDFNLLVSLGINKIKTGDGYYPEVTGEIRVIEQEIDERNNSANFDFYDVFKFESYYRDSNGDLKSKLVEKQEFLNLVIYKIKVV